LMESAGVVLKREIKKNPFAVLGSLFMIPALKQLKKQVDYSEYGGAPLLGVNGVCMISHGRSTGKAIRNAIRAAEGCVSSAVIAHIREGVAVG